MDEEVFFLENEEQAQSDELYEHHRYVADPGQSPLRIDKFLMARMEKISRSRVQDAIRAGSVLVDNEEVKPNYKIRPGNVVSIVLPEEPLSFEILPENIPLDIRYEDDDVMIINKPAGLVVHPGVGNYTGTLVNALAWYFKEKPLPVKVGHEHYQPGLVHRIDKDTSGLMVVAKNEYAMTHLARQFFDHTVQRTYWALVWGQPDPEEGTVICNLGRNPTDPLRFTVFPDGDLGKYAVTHYRTLEPMYYVSLVECNLETGRTHQIRVHMQYLGHPLFSDERYGGADIVKGTVFNKYRQFVNNCFKIMPRQALHAKTLGFVHPTTGADMHFDSELPLDFLTVLDKWRNYLAGRRELMERE